MLYPIFFFLLVCSVNTLDIAKPRTYQQVGRISRQIYNYNHPPFSEIDTVPVAVVYEDNNNQDGKTLGSNENVSEETSVAKEEDTFNVGEETKTDNIDIEEEPEIITIDSIIKTSKNQNTLLKLSTQFGTEREQKIPVAVIYDPPLEIKPKSIKVENSFKGRGRSRNLRTQTSRQSDSIETSRKQVHAAVSQRAEEVVQKETSLQHTTAKTTDTTTFARRTSGRDPVVRILESENVLYTQNGQFRYSYEGGDGTRAFSKGELGTVGDEKAGEAVSGGFSYKDKEGNDFSLTYTADENGYRPVGAHLPTPPPIPPAIARALAYLATKTTPEPVTEAYASNENP